MQSNSQTYLELAQAALGQTDDPRIKKALGKVIENRGDVAAACGAPPAGTYGAGDYLKHLLEETCRALVGKGEMVDYIESLRRKAMKDNLSAGLSAGALLLASLTQMEVFWATLIFLYLIPIGIRTLCRPYGV